MQKSHGRSSSSSTRRKDRRDGDSAVTSYSSAGLGGGWQPGGRRIRTDTSGQRVRHGEMFQLSAHRRTKALKEVTAGTLQGRARRGARAALWASSPPRPFHLLCPSQAPALSPFPSPLGTGSQGLSKPELGHGTKSTSGARMSRPTSGMQLEMQFPQPATPPFPKNKSIPSAYVARRPPRGRTG